MPRRDNWDRVWRWYLAAAVALTAVYFLMPLAVQNVYYYVLAASGSAAMVVGIRHHRPPGQGMWYLIAAGQALSVAGDVALLIWAHVLHSEASPGVPDVIYWIAYAFQITGLLGIARRRTSRGDLASLIDTAVLTGGFALVSWVTALKPALYAQDLTLAGRLTGFSYPAFDLLVLALIMRLLTGGGRFTVPLRLFSGAGLVYLAYDYWYVVAGQTALIDPNAFLTQVNDTGYLLAYVLFGAAALHPGMASVTAPAVEPRRSRLTRRRLVLLASATLIAPALLVWQYLRARGGIDVPAIAVGCVGMFLLVTARMAVLVRQVESQADLLSRQASRLEELAQRDGLTGLANRRTWDAALPAAMRRAHLEQTPLALAIIDIDHFKRFNDTHGHQAGDRLLEEAAAVWAGGLRSADLLARYGGEEFAALLPGVSEGDAVRLLDRLRPCTPLDQTFSAGVAVWDGVESGEELVARADAALYAAKRAGRDRVMVAGGSASTTTGGASGPL